MGRNNLNDESMAKCTDMQMQCSWPDMQNQMRHQKVLGRDQLVTTLIKR
jgi:hypothetical protein